MIDSSYSLLFPISILDLNHSSFNPFLGLFRVSPFLFCAAYWNAMDSTMVIKVCSLTFSLVFFVIAYEKSGNWGFVF